MVERLRPSGSASGRAHSHREGVVGGVSARELQDEFARGVATLRGILSSTSLLLGDGSSSSTSATASVSDSAAVSERTAARTLSDLAKASAVVDGLRSVNKVLQERSLLVVEQQDQADKSSSDEIHTTQVIDPAEAACFATPTRLQRAAAACGLSFIPSLRDGDELYLASEVILLTIGYANGQYTEVSIEPNEDELNSALATQFLAVLRTAHSDELLVRSLREVVRMVNLGIALTERLGSSAQVLALFEQHEREFAQLVTGVLPHWRAPEVRGARGVFCQVEPTSDGPGFAISLRLELEQDRSSSTTDPVSACATLEPPLAVPRKPCCQRWPPALLVVPQPIRAQALSRGLRHLLPLRSWCGRAGTRL